MSDVLVIFLLIGFAHWAAHVLYCKTCLRAAFNFGTFLLEGVVKTFSWPFSLFGYLSDIRRKEPEPLEEMMKSASKGEVIRVEQRENETEEAFRARMVAMIAEKMSGKAPVAGSDDPRTCGCDSCVAFRASNK